MSAPEAPLVSRNLGFREASAASETFKALGDPNRVLLLSFIASSPEGEACMCDLIEPVGLSQSTVSHHMRQLTDAGLVLREQRGRWAFYRINPEAFTLLEAALTFHSTPEPA